MKKVMALFILFSFMGCSSELSYITTIYENGIKIQDIKTCNEPDIHYYSTTMTIWDRCFCTGNMVFSMPYNEKVNTYNIFIHKIINE